MRYGVKGVGTQLTIETGVGDNWEKLGLIAVGAKATRMLRDRVSELTQIYFTLVALPQSCESISIAIERETPSTTIAADISEAN